MAKVSTLIPEVAVSFPDVTDDVIENALERAANRYFSDSKSWREMLEPSDSIANARAVDVEIPTGSQVVSLVKCKVDGIELALAGTEILFPPEESSKPKRAYIEYEELVFDGYLDGTEVIDVMVALTPKRTGGTIPDRLFDDASNALISGAMSELYKYPRTEYRDPSLAQAYEGQFMRDIMRAKSRAQAGRTHARRTVVYGGI